MGLMFLYLTPAFFVDITETWISATKMQRLATIIAGIWIEVTICGLAMVIWTNTQPGQFLHDFTYKVILITGLAVVVMNLNPLLKLDGYYFMTEAIGIPDLKERSTAFVAAWFQSFFLRLPVEVPAIPRRRAPLFVVYAVVSGAYSYLLLFAFLRFTYNLSSKLLAEFALIPVAFLALVMFRSRLKSLGGVLGHFRQHHFGSGMRVKPMPAAAALGLMVLLVAPIWRVREDAYFVVESPSAVTLHAAIGGRVDAVYVREGEHVTAGQSLLRMDGNAAAAMLSSAAAGEGAARYQAFEAQLHGQSIGLAAAGEEAASQAHRIAAEAQASLLVTAPESGVVLTADPAALVNRRVASGGVLLQLAGDTAGTEQATASPVVRIYLPAGALDRVQPGAEVGLLVPGRLSVLRLRLGNVDGEAVPLPAGLIAHQDYKGIVLPTFYTSRLTLPSSASAMPLGTAGEAKVFGARRSILGRLATIALDLARKHVW